MSAPLLSVRDLEVTYRSGRSETPAVRNISFDVAAGELVSLVGESGSGKSSTAHAIVDLLPAGTRVDGHLELDGTRLTGLTGRQWRAIRGRRIGFVPQDPTASLNPTKRVGRQVAEAIRVHDRAVRGADVRRRVLELLEAVGIPDPDLRAGQYPHELSGGMRQRVLIAAALANRPQLVIADEPTSALDVTVQRQILDHVDLLRSQLGLAVLLITHDLGIAADRSDSVVVLSEGQVAEQGSVEQIVGGAAHPYTRRLLAAVPRIDHGRLQWDAATATVRPRPVDATTRHDDTPRDAVLDARGLSKTFTRGRRSVTAVDDVSVRVPRGGTLGIVGESGSGKTTLARLLIRLESADAGTVRLDGEDITGLRGEALRQLRRRVQTVYQNPFASIDPRFTVAETLAEPLRAFGVGDRQSRRSRGAELLTEVGLPTHFLDRKPVELSGGQLQRVAIARAVAIEPSLLVLDEAVSALDVSVQAQILELLARLQASHDVSYLFISHDLAVVRQISDEVAVMRRGVVVEQGPADALFAAPRSEYTRDLLAAVPGRGLQAPLLQPQPRTLTELSEGVS